MMTDQTSASPQLACLVSPENTVQVRVFHNLSRDHFSGFRPGHPMLEVFAYWDADQPATPLDVANRAYRLLNVGDDPEFGTPDPRAIDYRAAKNRSFSVGDVLAIDDQYWACESAGWSPHAWIALVLKGKSGSTAWKPFSGFMY